MKKLIILTLFLATTFIYARGFLVPKSEKHEPFMIKNHRVEATIKNGAAKTIIRETFINPHNRDMEGIFVFPVPKGASVSLFRMKMKGKWVSGRVLEKNRARNIYNRIVRQMKDPGLIEYMGNDMFRASVYPIPKNGEMDIEITYTQTTNLTGNIYSYKYPVKGKGKVSSERIYRYCGHYYYGHYRRHIPRNCVHTKDVVQEIKTKEDFTFTARIESDIPIKSVYSPSHKLDIIKKEKKVTLGFEKNQSHLNKDIEVYYTVDPKDIGASVLAYKPADEKNGYFMMMISPKSEVDKKEIENKNLLLVVDTSGSMSGDKMKYAKKSLKYIVNRLNQGDTFNIIRFSSGVDYFKEKPVEVNDQNIKDALAYIEDLYASGGTAIDEALKEGLKQASDKLVNMMVFITDGRPTVGEIEIPVIVDNASKHNKKDVKIFSFGIGDDLNAVLVDKIANKNNGTSDYMKPGAEIETVISAFYDKVAFPVLRNLKIKMNGVKIYDLYPYKINDLFKGEELRVFGRYKIKMNGDSKDKSFVKQFMDAYNKGKKSTLVLTGMKKGKKEVYEFNINFKSFDNNDFIPNIWATKKVGFLLEEIRLNGEKKELVDEVKALATKFAIVTPYTSYLAIEPEMDKDYGLGGNIGSNKGGGRDLADSTGRRPSKVLRALKKSRSGGSSLGFGAVSDDEASAQPMALKEASGSAAVRTSKTLRKMKKEDKAKSRYGRRVSGGKVFILQQGVWVDSSRKTSVKRQVIYIKYMSDAYVKLVSKNRKLRAMLSVGKNVDLIYGKYKIIVRVKQDQKENVPASWLK